MAATAWPYTRLTSLPSRFSRTRQIPARPDRIRHRWAHATHRTAPSASEVARIANVAGPVPPDPEVVAEGAATAAAAFGSDGTGRLITRMLALWGRPIPGPNGPRQGPVPVAATPRGGADSRYPFAWPEDAIRLWRRASTSASLPAWRQPLGPLWLWPISGDCSRSHVGPSKWRAAPKRAPASMSRHSRRRCLNPRRRS